MGQISASSTDPLDSRELVERYYQSIAPQYSRHRRIHPEVLRCLVSLVQLGAGSAVLEIGCGTGNYISAVRETVGCECWGVDPAEAMLAEARRRSSAVRFIRASAQALPGDRFDLVFAVDVVHHSADRPRAFAECRRILRPGGKLCLVTESAAMIRRREPHASYFPQAVEIELARYPSVPALRAELAAAGFGEVQESEAEIQAELADIEPYRTKVHSSLKLMSDGAFAAGLKRLERDLSAGPIPLTWRYLLLIGAKSGGDSN